MFAGHGILTVALFQRVIRCGSTNYLTEWKPRSFNFTVDISFSKYIYIYFKR